MKIGVITDCFKKSHFEGIETAAKLGLDGVQIYATTGDFSPETRQSFPPVFSERRQERFWHNTPIFPDGS